MKLRKDIIERFISDFKLPINISDVEYFDYFINLYDKHYNTKKSLQLLEDTINKYVPDGIELTEETWNKAQSDFLTDFYSIREEILQTLSETEAYHNFIESKEDVFFGKVDISVCGHTPTKKSDIYSIENDGKYFLSLDFKKANFQALKLYDKNIVLGADTYEEMISKFTNLDYIKNSKYIREVIFGKLNVSRQISLEKVNTSKLLKYIVENMLPIDALQVYTTDEIIFRMDELWTPEKCLELSNSIKRDLGFDIRIESYELKSIEGKDYYVKKCTTGEEVFKKIPAPYFAQIYKKYLGLEITETDLLFYFEKKLARFVDPVI